VGLETLSTDGKIPTDIAKRSPTDTTTAGVIVSKHAREETVGGKKGSKSRDIHGIKRALRKIIKRDIFSLFTQ